MTPPENGLNGGPEDFSAMGSPAGPEDSFSDDSGVVVEGIDSVVPTTPSEDDPENY